MKNFKLILLGLVGLCLFSCAKKAQFPVSSVTPAAEITATMKQDKNENYLIEVTAKNLASADRLNPPMNNYIVWIVSENSGIQNIGQLFIQNGEKAYLKTSTPYKVKEIFITAEQKGSISYPSNFEISRTIFE